MLLDKWFTSEKADRYWFQLERGKETGRLHFQAAVSFGTKNKPGQRKTAGALRSSFKKFLSENAGPDEADEFNVNFSPAHDNKAVQNYVVKKDETFVEGPWFDPRKTREMALNINQEYKGEDLPKEWRGWQKEILNLVEQEAHKDDPIIWVYNPHGGAGKTVLCKYLTWKHEAMVIRWQACKDTDNIVVRTGQRNIYVFDLQRNKGKDFTKTDLYSSLENIKDGVISSGKYEGGKLIMKPPHVLVFANFRCREADFSKGRIMVITYPDFKNFERSDTFDKYKYLLPTARKAEFEPEEQPEAKRQKISGDVEVPRAQPQDNKEEDDGMTSYWTNALLRAAANKD